jgi:hypothetical protein
MRFTNNHNLSPAVYKALTSDRYVADEDAVDQRTDYSITTIMNPPKQVLLKKRHLHGDHIVEDASDRLWSMLGSIMHELLAEQAEDSAIVEKRLYLNVFDRLISGQVDHYSNGTITDYKFTKVWKIKESKFEDWEIQLNCYAYLYRAAGLPVNNLKITAILRDWSKHLRFTEGYPKSDIVEIELSLWDEVTQQKFLIDKVKSLVSCETLSDKDLPPCTPEEMWQKDTVYAIMKPGSKRSSKNYSALKEANAHILNLDLSNRSGGEYIQTREGSRTRCESFCAVSSVCSQYQEYLLSKSEVVVEEVA